MIEGKMTLRVRVTGMVQGVSYRAWVRREAEALGLDGWVRNESDGSVTVLIGGPTSIVDRMLHALWDGPAAAMVASVEAEPAEPPEARGFAIL